MYTWPRAGFDLTLLVVIGTGCIISYKSNYHTITTTTASKIVMEFCVLQNATKCWAILLLIVMSIKEHAYKQYIQYCDRSMKGNEMKGKEMNMVEHLYIHIKPPPTPRNKLQSNMPYNTFQGNIEMRSP